jgi:hypothetical protein
VRPATVERRRPGAALRPWRLNVLRIGYLVLGVGLAVVKWPELLHHDRWELMEGVVNAMLVALSLLALLGLRHPLRMLPVLLFESAWKLIWLGVVALPLWTDGRLDAATRETARDCLLVVVVLAAIPWPYAYRRYVTDRGDPWRRRGIARPERARAEGDPVATRSNVDS